MLRKLPSLRELVLVVTHSPNPDHFVEEVFGKGLRTRGNGFYDLDPRCVQGSERMSLEMFMHLRVMDGQEPVLKPKIRFLGQVIPGNNEQVD